MRWLLLLLTVLGACNDAPPCTPNTTRCLSSLAQVCGSDEAWHDVVDCAELGRSDGLPWRCTAIDGGLHACDIEDAGLE